jgi:hypothetical protein
VQLFHTDIVKKFDKYDAKFESRQKIVPYNPREEVRKVSRIILFFHVNENKLYLHLNFSLDAPPSGKTRFATTINCR